MALVQLCSCFLFSEVWSGSVPMNENDSLESIPLESQHCISVWNLTYIGSRLTPHLHFRYTKVPPQLELTPLSTSHRTTRRTPHATTLQPPPITPPTNHPRLNPSRTIPQNYNQDSTMPTHPRSQSCSKHPRRLNTTSPQPPITSHLQNPPPHPHTPQTPAVKLIPTAWERPILQWEQPQLAHHKHEPKCVAERQCYGPRAEAIEEEHRDGAEV